MRKVIFTVVCAVLIVGLLVDFNHEVSGYSDDELRFIAETDAEVSKVFGWRDIECDIVGPADVDAYVLENSEGSPEKQRAVIERRIAINGDWANGEAFGQRRGKVWERREDGMVIVYYLAA